jgi:hypothetical protein
VEVRQISLVYPNGRTHDTILRVSDDFNPGYEFDLHGRRWRVDGPGRGRRSEWLVCICIGRAESARLQPLRG